MGDLGKFRRVRCADHELIRNLPLVRTADPTSILLTANPAYPGGGSATAFGGGSLDTRWMFT